MNGRQKKARSLRCANTSSGLSQVSEQIMQQQANVSNPVVPPALRRMARKRQAIRSRLVALPCSQRASSSKLYQRLALLLAKLDEKSPWEKAVRGAAVMPVQARNKLRLADLSSLEAITHGKGRMQDLRILIDACNIAQCLACDFGIGGEEVKESITRAEMAILQCAARFERTQRFGLTGQALQDLREMLDWAQAQREVTSRSTYLKAVDLLTARVRAGHNTIDLDQACLAINGRGVAA